MIAIRRLSILAASTAGLILVWSGQMFEGWMCIIGALACTYLDDILAELGGR